MRRFAASAAVILGALALADNALCAEVDLRAQATTALRKAVAFYRTNVACDAAYLWRYSADLKLRVGEGKIEK